MKRVLKLLLCVVAGMSVAGELDAVSYGDFKNAVNIRNYRERGSKLKELLSQVEDANEITDHRHSIAALLISADLSPFAVKIIEKGENPNLKGEKGDFPLMLAIKASSSRLVKLLLQKGADPNVQDSLKRSALTLAKIKREAPILEALIDHGALVTNEDINEIKMRVIGLFSYLSNPAILRKIVENQKDATMGLLMALKNGFPDLAEKFLDRGADPHAKNRRGKKVITLAQKKNYPNVMRKIIEKSSKRSEMLIEHLREGKKVDELAIMLLKQGADPFATRTSTSDFLSRDENEKLIELYTQFVGKPKKEVSEEKAPLPPGGERAINMVILLDQDKDDKVEPMGPIAQELETALSSKNCFVLTSGYILVVLLAKEKKIINTLFNDFEIYKYVEPDFAEPKAVQPEATEQEAPSFLFLIIPKKYKVEVLQQWESCKQLFGLSTKIDLQPLEKEAAAAYAEQKQINHKWEEFRKNVLQKSRKECTSLFAEYATYLGQLPPEKRNKYFDGETQVDLEKLNEDIVQLRREAERTFPEYLAQLQPTEKDAIKRGLFLLLQRIESRGRVLRTRQASESLRGVGTAMPTDMEKALGLFVENRSILESFSKNKFEELLTKKIVKETNHSLKGELRKLPVEKRLGKLLDYSEGIKIGKWDYGHGWIPKTKCLPALQKVFVKNKNMQCGGIWNLSQSGHGSVAYIASITADDYKKEIEFFQKNLSVNTLLNTTCYKAAHIFSVYQQAEKAQTLKTDFTIINFGVTEGTTALGSRFNFVNLFSSLQQKNVLHLEKMFERHFPIDKFNIANLPFVRFPDQEYFLPMQLHKKNIYYLTSVRARKFPSITAGQKNIEIDAQKKYLLISPQTVPLPIKFTSRTTEVPGIYSILPGHTIHFLKELDIAELNMNLKTFTEKAFLEPAKKLQLASKKTFLIKRVQLADKTIENVAISISASLEEANRGETIGDLFFENQHIHFVGIPNKQAFTITTNPATEKDAFIKTHAIRYTSRIPHAAKLKPSIFKEVKEGEKARKPVRRLPLLPGQDVEDPLRVHSESEYPLNKYFSITATFLKKTSSLLIGPWDFMWYISGIEKTEFNKQMKRLGLETTRDNIRKLFLSQEAKFSDDEKEKAELVRLLGTRPKLDEKYEGGNTLLHRAVKINSLELIQQILGNYANRRKLIEIKNNEGKTPFDLSLQADLEIENFLREKLKIKLEFALKAALRRNLHINNPYEHGNTLLHQAVIISDFELVQHIAQRGANPLARNDEGKDSLTIALEKSRGKDERSVEMQIYRYLTQHAQRFQIPTGRRRKTPPPRPPQRRRPQPPIPVGAENPIPVAPPLEMKEYQSSQKDWLRDK